MSIAEADKLLENYSMTTNKSYCFSDLIPTHLVIPGTQDPEPGILWYKGDKVKVKISEGRFPSVIGMNQLEAEQTIVDANLTPQVIIGRNETVLQGFVFDQEPKKVGCRFPDVVKIFVNAPLRISNITLKPSIIRNNRNIVPETVMVSGYVSSRLKKNEHLWTAIRPLLFNNWFPQISPGEITPDDNGIFQGSAYFYGNNSDLYEIGVLILGNETNERFHEWELSSNRNADWGPINDRNNSNVTDTEINNQKLAALDVELQQKASDIWKPQFVYPQPKSIYPQSLYPAYNQASGTLQL